MTHLYGAFFPKHGLAHQLNGRAAQVGSGRLADIAPGLRSLAAVAGLRPRPRHRPRARHDTVGTGAIVDPKTGAPIIFDDQYMNSLVSIGSLGVLGVLWFVWGAGIACSRPRGAGRGRRRPDRGVCGRRVVGFAAGMLTFDAFSFVQCTLLFFVVAALGLRLRTLTPNELRRRAQMRTQLGADAPSMARGAAANVSGALLTTVFSFALSPPDHPRRQRWPLRPLLDRLDRDPARAGARRARPRHRSDPLRGARQRPPDDERAVRGSMQTALLLASAASAALAGAHRLAGAVAEPTTSSTSRTPRTWSASSALSLPALAIARVLSAGLQGLGIMDVLRLGSTPCAASSTS